MTRPILFRFGSAAVWKRGVVSFALLSAVALAFTAPAIAGEDAQTLDSVSTATNPDACSSACLGISSSVTGETEATDGSGVLATDPSTLPEEPAQQPPTDEGTSSTDPDTAGGEPQAPPTEPAAPPTEPEAPPTEPQPQPGDVVPPTETTEPPPPPETTQPDGSGETSDAAAGVRLPNLGDPQNFFGAATAVGNLPLSFTGSSLMPSTADATGAGSGSDRPGRTRSSGPSPGSPNAPFSPMAPSAPSPGTSVPGGGSGGGSFFSGFAVLVAAMSVGAVARLSRRQIPSVAVWCPVAFVSPLERPG
jgi:hypothetical protein